MLPTFQDCFSLTVASVRLERCSSSASGRSKARSLIIEALDMGPWQEWLELVEWPHLAGIIASEQHVTVDCSPLEKPWSRFSSIFMLPKPPTLFFSYTQLAQFGSYFHLTHQNPFLFKTIQKTIVRNVSAD